MLFLVLLAVPLQLDGGAEAPPPAEDASVSIPAADAGVAEPEILISDKAALFEPRPTPAGKPPFRARVRLGFLNEWGNHPGAPLGLTLGVRLGGEIWGAVLEAWGLVPNSIGDITGTGSLSVGSFGGVLGLCHEHPVLSGSLMGCVLGRAGAMRFEPKNISDLSGEWQPVVAAGLRAGGEWPRDSFLAFYVALHAFVPITRGYLRGENVGWAQSWVFGGAQVGFRLRLE